MGSTKLPGAILNSGALAKLASQGRALLASYPCSPANNKKAPTRGLFIIQLISLRPSFKRMFLFTGEKVIGISFISLKLF